MKAKTLSSKEIWKSSDGQRTIWEVTLKADDGKSYGLKTYSSEIAQVGFEGDVETYINPKGDRFVKQPKPEGGFKGGNKPNNQPVIQAQWAIGQARGFIRDRGEILPEDEYWVEVQKTAVKLIEIVNNIIGGSESPNPKVKLPTKNPATYLPSQPVWPSDIKDDADAISLYATAALADVNS